MKEEEPQKQPFHELVALMLDESTPLPAKYIYRLSDIDPADFSLLEEQWTQIPIQRRRAILEDVEDFNSDFVLNFKDFTLLACKDNDPNVRLMALRTLADYQDPILAQLFVQLSEQDPVIEIRAAAASAVGTMVYLGELEELPAQILQQMEACLLRLSESQDGKLVRLRALEGLGYSSRKEVPSLIKAAFESGDPDWQCASLLAMGRSYAKEWHPYVIEALENDHPDVQSEAVLAAGELEISEVLPLLLDFLDEEDKTIRQASIWAVSQIGGEQVSDRLNQLYERTEDVEEENLIEDALENLEFTEGVRDFTLLDLGDADPDDDDFLELDFDQDE